MFLNTTKTNKRYNRINGEYKAETYDDLLKSIKLFNIDRPVNHIDKIKLTKGDCAKTSKYYIKDNPECNVRILHLSMNIYKPTAKMLEVFLPQNVKGFIGCNRRFKPCHCRMLQSLKRKN